VRIKNELKKSMIDFGKKVDIKEGKSMRKVRFKFR